MGLDQGGHRRAPRAAAGRGPRSRSPPPPPLPPPRRPWRPVGVRAGTAGACARRGRRAARPAAGPGSRSGPCRSSPSRVGRPGSHQVGLDVGLLGAAGSSPSSRALRASPGCSRGRQDGAGTAIRTVRAPDGDRSSRQRLPEQGPPRWMRLRTVPTGTSRALADLLVGQPHHVAQHDRGPVVLGQAPRSAACTSSGRASAARATSAAAAGRHHPVGLVGQQARPAGAGGAGPRRGRCWS